MTRIFRPSRRRLLDVLAAALILGPASKALAQVVSTLKIATIGAGAEGGALGTIFARLGHPVMFSSRHPEELKGLVSGLGQGARAGTVAEAIAFADVVFLAVPYGAVPQIGRDFGAALKGKVVLDACNAVAARDGAIAEEVEREGIGVTSQKYLTGARVVRAFNTMGYTTFAREAHRADPKLAIPIAGDDAEALRIATALVLDAGFDPVAVGKLLDARRFQRGAPGYGQPVSASELRQKLSLTQ